MRIGIRAASATLVMFVPASLHAASREASLPAASATAEAAAEAPSDEEPSGDDIIVTYAGFNGLTEKRRHALIDIDRDVLEARMRRYLDPAVPFEQLVAEN